MNSKQDVIPLSDPLRFKTLVRKLSSAIGYRMVIQPISESMVKIAFENTAIGYSITYDGKLTDPCTAVEKSLNFIADRLSNLLSGESPYISNEPESVKESFRKAHKEAMKQRHLMIPYKVEA